MADGNKLLQLAMSYVKTEVLGSTMELGLYDTLEVQGAQSCKQLTDKLNVANHEDFEKVLNLCVYVDVLKKTAQNDGADLYSNNELSSKFLVKGKPDFIGDWVKFVTYMVEPKGYLLNSLKSGLRKGKGEIFLFNEDKDFLKGFQAGMATIARNATTFVDTWDLSHYKTYIDVGGGTGTFARAMADTYPDMDVSVFELERVAETAKSLPPNKNSRIKYVTGNFFTDELPSADLYSLNHILHDWNDESSGKILSAISKAINPGGAILLLEALQNDNKVGPGRVCLCEVAALSYLEGKERCQKEFEQMFAKYGFGKCQVVRNKGLHFYDGLLFQKMDPEA